MISTTSRGSKSTGASGFLHTVRQAGRPVRRIQKGYDVFKQWLLPAQWEDQVTVTATLAVVLTLLYVLTYRVKLGELKTKQIDQEQINRQAAILVLRKQEEEEQEEEKLGRMKQEEEEERGKDPEEEAVYGQAVDTCLDTSCSSSSDDSDSSDSYIEDKILVIDLGSRLHKYWNISEHKDKVTISMNKSRTMPLMDEDFKPLNKFLGSLQHPSVQPIHSIKSCSHDDGREMMIISQPFWREGSLRDVIHKTTPCQDWAEKYGEDTGTALVPEKVVVFGSQILNAMLYLYKKQFKAVSLRPLGHVQTGNIRVQGDVCRLGGYENTLLGYKTSMYKSIEDNGLLKDIDIIMFGHVVFEMSTGYHLTYLLPTEADYTSVENSWCRDALRYIFKRSIKGHFKHSIKKIKMNKFFTKSQMHSSMSISQARQFISKVVNTVRPVANLKVKVAETLRKCNTLSPSFRSAHNLFRDVRFLPLSRSSCRPLSPSPPFVSLSRSLSSQSSSPPPQSPSPSSPPPPPQSPSPSSQPPPPQSPSPSSQPPPQSPSPSSQPPPQSPSPSSQPPPQSPSPSSAPFQRAGQVSTPFGEVSPAVSAPKKRNMFGRSGMRGTQEVVTRRGGEDRGARGRGKNKLSNSVRHGRKLLETSSTFMRTKDGQHKGWSWCAYSTLCLLTLAILLYMYVALQ